jgi:hypothetical protein
MSDWWSGSVDLLTRPLLPTPVGLRVRVVLRCRWCSFCSSDEVLGPLVSGDVEVRLSTQLFRYGQRFLQYGLDEGRIIRSPIEVFNNCCLSDLTDTISHGLKPLEVCESAFIPFVSFGDLDDNTFKILTSLLSVEQEIKYDEHT